jgi:hypothetical protein
VFHLIFKQDFRNIRQMESAHAEWKRKIVHPYNV